MILKTLVSEGVNAALKIQVSATNVVFLFE